MNKKTIIILFLVSAFLLTILFLFFKNTSSPSKDFKEAEKEKKIIKEKLNIKVNGRVLSASLENNSSTMVLVSKLKEGTITLTMDDYANQEKVGSLGFSLPRNDKKISVDYGDLILYQGNSFVIYYDTNRWNLTKLGHIDGVSQDSLKEFLGDGKITVEISLEK